jgi:hypothetical protein
MNILIGQTNKIKWKLNNNNCSVLIYYKTKLICVAFNIQVSGGQYSSLLDFSYLKFSNTTQRFATKQIK